MFVTVGTTSFDAFVSAACSPSFASALHAKGYRRVVLQVGRGSFTPPTPTTAPEEEVRDTRATKKAAKAGAGAGSGAGGSTQGAAGDAAGPWSFSIPVSSSSSPPPAPIPVTAYRFKPNIAEDIAGAALVVSHAGAGSIFESLRASKPLLVVVNTSLADNHQTEIAAALSAPASSSSSSSSTSGPHLAYCEPHTLVEAVEKLDVRKLRPLPVKDASRFTGLVDRLMGHA